MENILKSIKEEKSLTLSENELKKVSDYIESLKSKSADGEKYRTSLCAKIKSYFSLTVPEISSECVDEMIKYLSTENLEQLSKTMSKKANTVVPIKGQLYTEEKKNDNSNSQFKF